MLTDTRIRNAKPDTRPIKLTDAFGLHLLIQPHRQQAMAAGLSLRWEAEDACPWRLSRCRIGTRSR